jgi:hypothetical protein
MGSRSGMGSAENSAVWKTVFGTKCVGVSLCHWGRRHSSHKETRITLVVLSNGKSALREWRRTRTRKGRCAYSESTRTWRDSVIHQSVWHYRYGDDWLNPKAVTDEYVGADIWPETAGWMHQAASEDWGALGAARKGLLIVPKADHDCYASKKAATTLMLSSVNSPEPLLGVAGCGTHQQGTIVCHLLSCRALLPDRLQRGASASHDKVLTRMAWRNRRCQGGRVSALPDFANALLTLDQKLRPYHPPPSGGCQRRVPADSVAVWTSEGDCRSRNDERLCVLEERERRYADSLFVQLNLMLPKRESWWLLRSTERFFLE